MEEDNLRILLLCEDDRGGGPLDSARGGYDPSGGRARGDTDEVTGPRRGAGQRRRAVQAGHVRACERVHKRERERENLGCLVCWYNRNR